MARMQSDRVLTNFWEFPISFGKSGAGFRDNGVFRWWPSFRREIEAAASNDFESTRLVGRVIQFEYVCVAGPQNPADDSHRRSRNRSSRRKICI